MNTENIKKEKVLSSVQNALRILRCFSMEEPEKKISDLAVSMGLAKSTVCRKRSGNATLPAGCFRSGTKRNCNYPFGNS
jgi:hypothetical protein